MPRKPKPFTYNDLSTAELRLLEYPPTEKSWVCPGRYNNEEKTACKMVNSGDKCWVCGTKKPSKPTYLWPKYIAICEKVGIEPGTRWKKVSSRTGLVFDKKKWVEIDMKVPTT